MASFLKHPHQAEKDAGLAFVLLCHAVPDLLLNANRSPTAATFRSKKLPLPGAATPKVASDVAIPRGKTAGQRKIPVPRRAIHPISAVETAVAVSRLPIRPWRGPPPKLHRAHRWRRLHRPVFSQMRKRTSTNASKGRSASFSGGISRKPVVLLAREPRFAPIKSIVERVLQAGIERPMARNWGAQPRLASIWTRWRKAGKNAGRIQVCAGIVDMPAGEGLARPHRSGSSGGDGRSCPICPDIGSNTCGAPAD